MTSLWQERNSNTNERASEEQNNLEEKTTHDIFPFYGLQEVPESSHAA